MATIRPCRPSSSRRVSQSYDTDFAQHNRDDAAYVARILKGESLANLPIMLPSKFTLAINLSTAKALGLVVPPASSLALTR